METFLKYYAIAFIFYVAEIYIFKFSLSVWSYDIFWLNILIRSILSSLSAVILRKILFSNSANFYIKFAILIISSPLISSILLKVLLLNNLDVIFTKIVADLLSSLIIFVLLKKIS